jgi:rod shape determining protein RodA
MTIYSAAYNTEHPFFFDFSQPYGKQFIWIIISSLIGIFILNVNSRLFSAFAYVYYIISLLLLVIVFFLAKEVNGAKAWIDLGFFRLQPSEFAKFTTALALSAYISNLENFLSNKKQLFYSILLILVPFAMVLAQHDMGSALVFLSFVFLLNRFGLSTLVIIFGVYLIVISVLSLLIPTVVIAISLILIAMAILYYLRKRKEIVQIALVASLVVVLSSIYSFSIDLVISKLDAHQKDRINVMIGKGGNDWNVRQSKIAIGAGQFFGKGYLKGTQSKGNFLPAKETDFIFCTIGEEWGFLGSLTIIILYVYLMFRILKLAEKQKSKFAKVYGYGIVCIFMIHFLINVGMTLGVVPVIGIPLPALSYGGSSLISFTVLVFLFIKMDSEKWIYT